MFTVTEYHSCLTFSGNSCTQEMEKKKVFGYVPQTGMKSYCRQNAFTNWCKCRLTFRRQAFVTTCLGSTTSTRGSLMATLRMQLMSNPYTFSHPVHTKNKPDTHMNDHAHNMCFLGFFSPSVFRHTQSSVLPVPAKLSAQKR